MRLVLVLRKHSVTRILISNGDNILKFQISTQYTIVIDNVKPINHLIPQDNVYPLI